MQADNVDGMQVAIAAGAPIDTVTPALSMPPIFHAIALGGAKPALCVLLAHGANVDVHSPPPMPRTPLVAATLKADVLAVRHLLRAGASLGEAPHWSHLPYSYVDGVQPHEPRALQRQQIKAMFDAAILQRQYGDCDADALS